MDDFLGGDLEIPENFDLSNWWRPEPPPAPKPAPELEAKPENPRVDEGMPVFLPEPTLTLEEEERAVAVEKALQAAIQSDHMLFKDEFLLIFQSLMQPRKPAAWVAGLNRFLQKETKRPTGLLDMYLYPHLSEGPQGAQMALYETYFKGRLSRDVVEPAFEASFLAGRVYHDSVKPLLDDGVLSQAEFESVQGHFFESGSQVLLPNGIASLGWTLFMMHYTGARMERSLFHLIQEADWAKDLDQVILGSIDLWPIGKAEAILARIQKDLDEINATFIDENRVDQVSEVIHRYQTDVRELEAIQDDPELMRSGKKEIFYKALTAANLKLGDLTGKFLWRYDDAVVYFKKALQAAQKANFAKGVQLAQNNLIDTHEKRLRHGIWHPKRFDWLREAHADLKDVSKLDKIRLATQEGSALCEAGEVPPSVTEALKAWQAPETHLYRTVFNFQRTYKASGRLNIQIHFPDRDHADHERASFTVSFESDVVLNPKIKKAFEEDILASLKEVPFDEHVFLVAPCSVSLALELPPFKVSEGESFWDQHGEETILTLGALDQRFRALWTQAESATMAYPALLEMEQILKLAESMRQSEERDQLLSNLHRVLGAIYFNASDFAQSVRELDEAALLSQTNRVMFEVNERDSLKASLKGLEFASADENLKLKRALETRLKKILGRNGWEKASRQHQAVVESILEQLKTSVLVSPPRQPVQCKDSRQGKRAVAVLRRDSALKKAYFELEEKQKLSGTLEVQLHVPPKGASDTYLRVLVENSASDPLTGFTGKSLEAILNQMELAALSFDPDQAEEIGAQSRWGTRRSRVDMRRGDVEVFENLRLGRGTETDCYISFPITFHPKEK